MKTFIFILPLTLFAICSCSHNSRDESQLSGQAVIPRKTIIIDYSPIVPTDSDTNSYDNQRFDSDYMSIASTNDSVIFAAATALRGERERRNKIQRIAAPETPLTFFATLFEDKGYATKQEKNMLLIKGKPQYRWVLPRWNQVRGEIEFIKGANRFNYDFANYKKGVLNSSRYHKSGEIAWEDERKINKILSLAKGQ